MIANRCRTVAWAAALALAASPLSAQAPAGGASSDLEFLGFRAGAPLADVAAHLDELGGGDLRCDRSRADARVQECRAQLVDPEDGSPLDLWLSAIDSTAAVLTLSSELAPEALDRIRADLERRFGRVGARAQNQQWMMQWVRRGTMMRLTWRVQQGDELASVSLIDGRVLDGWQAPRGRRKG